MMTEAVYEASKDIYEQMVDQLMPMASFLVPEERKTFYTNALKTCVAISTKASESTEAVKSAN